MLEELGAGGFKIFLAIDYSAVMKVLYSDNGMIYIYCFDFKICCLLYFIRSAVRFVLL